MGLYLLQNRDIAFLTANIVDDPKTWRRYQELKLDANVYIPGYQIANLSKGC